MDSSVEMKLRQARPAGQMFTSWWRGEHCQSPRAALGHKSTRALDSP